MNKEQVKKFLKQMRKTAGLSAEDVSIALKEYGFDFAPKTVFGWEGKGGTPNADVFLALCEIYHCDNPMDFFGDTTITPEESMFMSKFRALSPYAQETIRILIDRELESQSEVSET